MAIFHQAREGKSPASFIVLTMRKIIIAADEVRNPAVFLQYTDHFADFDGAIRQPWKKRLSEHHRLWCATATDSPHAQSARFPEK
jgi:hypothetical protein